MRIHIVKLFIRLLILMIFFVILFLILSVLYSTRYWPDIYSYLNKNITIKRIPTISELNLTELEVFGTTENYSTIIEDMNVAELEIEMEENKGAGSNETVTENSLKRRKRYDFEDDFDNDNSTETPERYVEDYDVYADVPPPRSMSKAKKYPTPFTSSISDMIYDRERRITLKHYPGFEETMKLLQQNTRRMIMTTEAPEDSADSTFGNEPGMFPWLITIFTRKSNLTSQFEYYCDGALLTENLAVTAARCLHMNDTAIDPANILVIIGKTSLLTTTDGAHMTSVKEIIIHNDFKTVDGKVENDLALIKFREPTSFHENFDPASVGSDLDTVQKAFTTAWNLKGDIEAVGLDIKDDDECSRGSAGENTFCASYGQDVALCPSYGGIFAGYKAGYWRLYGIRTGDTNDRGLCFDKNIWFTNLYHYYASWIRSYY